MGEMITDIGMDMDGVVYPFVPAFQRYCAQRQGKLFLPDPTNWHFYEDWDMDESTFHQWLIDAANEEQVFASEDPYEGVVDAWNTLLSMGIRIHVVTARPQAAWEQTANWLTKHGLVANSLHFNSTKGFLTSFAKQKALVIDDHVQYYDEAERSGMVPVLLNRPWNQHKEDANRVNNLAELVSLIRGYNLVKKKDAKKLVTKEKAVKPYTDTDPYAPYKKKYDQFPLPRTKWVYPTKDDWEWHN